MWVERIINENLDPSQIDFNNPEFERRVNEKLIEVY